MYRIQSLKVFQYLIYVIFFFKEINYYRKKEACLMRKGDSEYSEFLTIE